jgi:hypothetical protein
MERISWSRKPGSAVVFETMDDGGEAVLANSPGWGELKLGEGLGCQLEKRGLS